MDLTSRIEAAYAIAREQYAQLGVDVDEAMSRLSRIAISIQCWQGDDVGGFESERAALGGGLAATGNYPGKARSLAELRGDLEKAMSLIPGRHRVNLHASYLDDGGRKVDRCEIGPEHFASWIGWGKGRLAGIDFNPTFFSHPQADTGFTLSSADAGIRRYWIKHGQACRRIAAQIGRAMGSPSINNVWIPDGYKDTPADRLAPRQRLAESLDEVFAEPFDKSVLRDSVEGKLFGIGSESYVVGSHDFYLGYAVSRRKLLCLDTGHFHPTESVADKVSSVMCFLDEILLHVSRGVRWDSDHAVTLGDELFALGQELVRGDFLQRVHIGLDYFDASINRVAAWVIGTRNMLKALLAALLEPAGMLRQFEAAGDLTGRLAMMEEAKSLPMAAVWDYYCLQKNVPVGLAWLGDVREYETRVLSGR